MKPGARTCSGVDDPWTANPAFRVDDGFLVNLIEGTQLELTGPLRRWVNAGWPIDALSREAHAALSRHRVIVPASIAVRSAEGLAVRVTTRAERDGGQDSSRPPWGLLGAPVDLGGPGPLRPRDAVGGIRTMFARRLRTLGEPQTWSWSLGGYPAAGLSRVIDHGDVVIDPRRDSGVVLHQRVADCVHHIVSRGDRPMLIGGDHSLSFPAITTVARHFPDLAVVHLDAHADRRRRGPSLTADCGNFVTWTRSGDPALPWLTIGVRGFDDDIDGGAIPGDIHYVTSHQATTDPELTATLQAFCGERPVYLTLDIDVLDPVYAPEVVYQSPGGLSPHTLMSILGSIAASAHLVAMDVVEACPSPAGRSGAITWATEAMTIALLADARLGFLERERR